MTHNIDSLVEGATALEHAANSLAVAVDEVKVAAAAYKNLRPVIHMTTAETLARLQRELALLKDLADIAAAVSETEIGELYKAQN
jgi:acetolactate synthase small subunit